jgi:hypothetical protein
MVIKFLLTTVVRLYLLIFYLHHLYTSAVHLQTMQYNLNRNEELMNLLILLFYLSHYLLHFIVLLFLHLYLMSFAVVILDYCYLCLSFVFIAYIDFEYLLIILNLYSHLYYLFGNVQSINSILSILSERIPS